MNDFYSLIPKSKTKIFNESKCIVPHPSRVIIVGSSGSGKTNCLLNLINSMNCFTQIYIYAKMIESDPLYSEVLIPNMQKIEKSEKITILKAIDRDVNNLPRVDSLNVEGNKLFIFDDLINCCASDMDKIADYYIASRKKNCTVVFITQDYTKLPPVIRTNANTVIITIIKATMALRTCLIDISDGDYNKVKNLYKKRNNVFIKTENDKGKILYALDSFKNVSRVVKTFFIKM